MCLCVGEIPFYSLFNISVYKEDGPLNGNTIYFGRGRLCVCLDIRTISLKEKLWKISENESIF